MMRVSESLPRHTGVTRGRVREGESLNDHA
jgi:hypothetical protein